MAKTKKAKKKATKPVVATGSVIPAEIRQRYKKSNTKTASGARSVSNGDDVAKALNGLTVETLLTLAKKACPERWEKWAKLNPGMQRMNLGNVLRGQIKKGDAVAIATIKEAAKSPRATTEKAVAIEKEPNPRTPKARRATHGIG
jgi:hypothetical protein